MTTRKLTVAAACALLLGIAGVAGAASYPDDSLTTPVASNDYIYFGGFGGIAFTPGNVSTTDPTTGAILNNVDHDTGWNAGAMLGYKTGDFRIEGEFVYMNSDVDHFNAAGIRQTGVSGDTEVYAGMANAYYDLNQFSDMFTPYLGVGVGYADVDTSLRSTGPAPGPISFRRSNGEFAYQGIVGFSVGFDEGFAAFVDYRYFGTTDVSGLGRRFQNHTINAGITVNLDGLA